MVKRRIIATTVPFVLATMLVFCPALFAKQPSRSVPAKGAPFGWELSGATVVESGKTEKIKEGTLISGYTIQAQAAGMRNAPVKNGVFRLTLTAFSPRFDLPGQKAGFWYVQGQWTITDETANPKLRQVRHNPAVIKGTLSAKLTADPRTYHGPVAAEVRVPRMADGAGRGQGTLQGDELFEGTLSLVLRR